MAKILYASRTPVVGVAPLFTRIVNRHFATVGHEARCLTADLGPFGWYARDRVLCPVYHEQDENQRNDCLEWADVVHSFNYSSPRNLSRPDLLGKKPWAHMICGDASQKLRHAWRDVDLPKAKFIVVAEGWHRADGFKRFEPYTLMPLLFDVFDSLHRHFFVGDRWRRASYSPSTRSTAPTKTNTKGYGLVQKALDGFPLDVIEDVLFDVCMQRKSVSWVGVDEVSTPMMHHSGPEWLALGIPCISMYDEFTERTWKDCFGCNEMPFINATMETLRDRVYSILQLNECDMQDIGGELIRWVHRYLNPIKWVERYLGIYDGL